MIFTPTVLADACIIDIEAREDHRGFFARTWCKEEFAGHGLSTELSQCSVSFNKKRGTLRGMHYQIDPHEEVKVIRCTAGSIYDVIIDLRPQSPTFRQHFGINLTAIDHRMLYIPNGFAHGFQTLEDNTEVFYQISTPYNPQFARGVRWNDGAFRIHWPIENPILLDRDRTYADY